MTEGLITRIGRWLDRKWQKNAKESDLDQLKLDLTQAIRVTNDQNECQWKDLALKVEEYQQVCNKALAALSGRIDLLPEASKEIGDLKSRIERLELYTGMMAKATPGKGAEVKSAFAM